MSLSHPVGAALLGVLLLAGSAAPQSVMVDEGTFAITINGKNAGTETFSIQQAGAGEQGTVIAHSVVKLSLPDGPLEVQPLLEATGLDGTVNKYQVKVSGASSLELKLTLSGNRYVSVIRSPAGEEEHEFLARPKTRILEEDVAHQYYFLRNVGQGDHTWVIVPRQRRQLDLVASAPTEDTLHIARTTVRARKVTFSAGNDHRTVWFDRQGRVLRVEVPARGYVAERQDLVG
jgi:hypothetical protein